MKKVILILVISLLTVSSYAQTTKVGTVDSEFILSKMPEYTVLLDEMKVYNKGLEKQLMEKLDNYDRVYKSAELNFETMTKIQKLDKQRELSELENDISKFRSNGSQLAQLKQEELLKPLYEKISNLIAIVAQELSYTQIIINRKNNLAYLDPVHDITERVLVKMGIL